MSLCEFEEEEQKEERGRTNSITTQKLYKQYYLYRDPD
jgi:hypothetical protein